MWRTQFARKIDGRTGTETSTEIRVTGTENFLEGSDSVIKHGVDKPGIWRSPYSPGNRQSIKAVNNRRKIDLSCRYMKLRDICQPLGIGLFCMEVPFYHVRNSGSYLPFIGVVLLALNIRNNQSPMQS